MKIQQRNLLICLIILATLVFTSDYFPYVQTPYQSFFSHIAGHERRTKDFNLFAGYSQALTIDNHQNENAKILCDKLLETCKKALLEEIPNQITSIDSDKESQSQQSISEKYMENKFNDTVTAINSPQNLSLQQKELVNKENLTQDRSFKTYENPMLSIRMLYPRGWEIVDENNSNILEVKIISPLEGKDDHYRENGIIRVSEISPGVSLDNYTSRIYDTVQRLKFLNMISSEPTTLSDNPAHRITAIRQSSQTINVIDEWTIKDSKAYRITFNIEGSKSSIYIPLAMSMRDSFEIFK